MYKAIFSDIDGTLFRNDLTVSRETAEAIRKAYESGIKIILCSGRYITGIDRAREQLDIPVIYSAINGALIKDGERYLREKRISPEAFSKAASFLNGKVSSLIAFCETRYAIDANDEWYNLQTRICGDSGMRMTITDPDEVFRVTGEHPYKLLAKDNDTEKKARLMEELREILGESAYVVSSSWNNFEILPPDVDKRDAIKIIASEYGMDNKDIIAFGDWDNDAGMIADAGLGIAMANGSEKAKAAARFVTKSNEDDGIAYALRHFGVI